MTYFTLFNGKDDQFYFNLKAGNNEIILQSEGYKTKQNALGGIKSIQENCIDKSHYEMKKTKNGKPFFVLKAANGETIGKSEEYNSNQAMENGIDSVCTNGVSEIIKDLTKKDDSKKEFEIYVNAQPKKWKKKEISFVEVVELAFGEFINNDRTCYTVTYSRGMNSKKEGLLVFNNSINVKSKMIFNVSATDKS